MEKSPKLESMPTLCRSATLPAETTISKWRVTVTIRQRLHLPTGGPSAFGGIRATASPPRPPSNFLDAPVFRSHQLPLYENECLEWQIHTQLPQPRECLIGHAPNHCCCCWCIQPALVAGTGHILNRPVAPNQPTSLP